MGMLYYWPTPQPPGDSWHRTKHTLFQVINLHGTKHRPEAASIKLLHSYEPQDGNEGDKHEVVDPHAVQARHNCPHEGHCTAIHAAATARYYIRRRFNALTVSALWRIDTGELNYERHV